MKYYVIPVTSLNQNCTLVWCEITNHAVLIDPGGDVEKLCKIVDMFDLKIKNILLTHGHLDHVGGAEELKKYYNVSIIGPHKNDLILLNNIFLQKKMMNFQCDLLNNRVIPDFWLKEGDNIKVGHESFKVLHCPGHSPGHVVFCNMVKKFIFMGDVLFRNSIGRTDFLGGNKFLLISSIKNKLIPLGDDFNFLPGHGVESNLGYERKNNIFLL